MKMPSNMEKINGNYVANCGDGFAFRIYRKGKQWYAYPHHLQHKTDNRRFSAKTLTELANKLANSNKG